MIVTAETNQNGTFTFYGITAGTFEFNFETMDYSPTSTTNITARINVPPTIMDGPYLLLCASSPTLPYYIAPLPDTPATRTPRP